MKIGEAEVSLWYDNWTGEGPLCTKIDYLHIADTQLKVKGVLLDGKWNLRELYTPIPDTLRHYLGKIALGTTEGVTDRIVWNSSLNGIYEAKSGYWWLLNKHRNLSPVQSGWKWVWKLPTTEKCKFLVWLICHEALPTNKMKSTRGVGAQPSCISCHIAEEIILHCLCD